MLFAFFYIVSMCDIYNESQENNFVLMPANCINDLKLLSAWPECARLAFNSAQQNWHHSGAGSRSRPQKFFITSGWQYCHMEPSECSPGILPESGKASSTYRQIIPGSPQNAFFYCPQSTQDNPSSEEMDLIRRMPRKLFIQVILPLSCNHIPDISQS